MSGKINFKFDPNKVVDDGGGDFTALPPGDYLVSATNVEQKPTKKNPKFWYLEYTLTVLEGQFKGRLIWVRFNLCNSQKGQEIAEREFLRLHVAVGLGTQETSPEMLLGIPLVVTLKPRKDDPKETEVKKFAPRGGVAQASQPPANSIPSTPEGTGMQDAGEKMPWE